MSHRKHTSHSQQGMTLIMLVFIIGLAVTAWLLYALNANQMKIDRDKKTAAALAEAKAALVGYLVSHDAKPGTLPCPDTNNDGSPDTSGGNACSSYIGRLPWKKLGLTMLRDGDGECLWYAISPVFRTQMNVVTRQANPINATTSGTITLVNDAGVAYPGINPVVAVVFAPGLPVAGQNRSGVATNYCPGDSVASKYLDSNNGVDNATGNVVGNNYTFMLGSSVSTFNDQLTYITANEIFPVLKKRMLEEILGSVAVHSGLVDYYESPPGLPHNTYPCPSATATGSSDCFLGVGYVPYNDASVGLQYAALGSWLTDNGWFAAVTYAYLGSTHTKVTMADGFGSYTCDANNNVFSCASP